MTETLKRVLGDGFRIFFPAAGIYAILAILTWVLWLAVHAAGGMVYGLPMGMPPHQWHAHEMIFGYGGAAMAGFLMTATPHWTGVKARPHRFILLAFLIWFAGRWALWFSASLPTIFVAVVDLMFLPLIAIRLAAQLSKRPKPQTLVFLLFVSFVWLGNLLVHLQWMGLAKDSLDTGIRVGLLSFCAMISVLGGRVTPGFTRNAMKREGVDPELWPETPVLLNRSANILALIIPLALLTGLPQLWIGLLALIAGCAQLVRLSFWRTRRVLDQPILWALHLAVFMLGTGQVLWGLSLLGFLSEVAALHILGIGAVGGMTLAIMSRAILGHTGHDLIAPVPLAFGYGLIAFSALLRWMASELSGSAYFPLTLAAGAVWIVAFLLFVTTIGPLVLSPRQTRPPH